MSWHVDPPAENKSLSKQAHLLTEDEYRAAIARIILNYCDRKGIDPRNRLTVCQHNGFIWGELVSAGILRPDMTRDKFVRSLTDRVWEAHCMMYIEHANRAKANRGRMVVDSKTFEENARARIEAIAQIEYNTRRKTKGR